MSVKQRSARLLSALGVPAVLRFCLRRRLTILTYHGFRGGHEVEDFSSYVGNHLAADKFASHLGFLKRTYHLISLTEALQGLDRGSLPDNALVLTIDDGYESIYRWAWPVLKKYQAPATVFLTTSFLDRLRPLWFDRLLYAFVISGQGTQAAQHNAFLKRCPQEQREEKLAALELSTGVRLDFNVFMPAVFRPLSWDQVREMNATGLVDFGAHGHEHFIMSLCTPEAQRADLLTCRDRIQAELGTKAVPFLAYPNGEQADFNEALNMLARDMGFRAVMSTLHGFNAPGVDSFLMKRISALDWMDVPDLEAQAVLLVKVLARLKPRFFQERRA